jgi:hypothetical protein
MDLPGRAYRVRKFPGSSGGRDADPAPDRRLHDSTAARMSSSLRSPPRARWSRDDRRGIGGAHNPVTRWYLPRTGGRGGGRHGRHHSGHALILSWSVRERVIWSRRKVIEAVAFGLTLLLAARLIFGGTARPSPCSRSFS